MRDAILIIVLFKDYIFIKSLRSLFSCGEERAREDDARLWCERRAEFIAAAHRAYSLERHLAVPPKGLCAPLVHPRPPRNSERSHRVVRRYFAGRSMGGDAWSIRGNICQQFMPHTLRQQAPSSFARQTRFAAFDRSSVMTIFVILF